MGSSNQLNQSGQLMPMGNASQSLLTAASLASVLGMQLSTLTSPPTTAVSGHTPTGGNDGTSLTSAQTMMVSKKERDGHWDDRCGGP